MLLVETIVDLETPTGLMRTYVYEPGRPPETPAPHLPRRYPGIVLYSEIYQRTGPIARLAAMMAGHGYIVVVPEIFHELHPAGTVLAYDAEGTAQGNADKLAKPIAAHDDDRLAAIAHLAGRERCSGAIGALGVCIGGHLAYRAALDPRVGASACFYATDLHKRSLGKGGDDSLARARDVRGELMMVFGRQDPHIPEDGRRLIRGTLAEAGICFTWHEVNAQHAFLRDEGPRYDPQLARWGVDATLAFFARTLG